ncbi:MAG TPA: galactitol-1-phosphate 5-dehydrogenase [Verrucomicrobiae bacterium]|nr:galactitol-1-phosphate 5-dehydrogenase [Verrucomicrobiae bacterium]
MKALVLQEYNRFDYLEVPEPQPGADEVLVAVAACGICGSDVHGMDGSTGRRRPPLIMGHEAAGTIAALGQSVRGWSLGDRVTFDSTIYCGRCEYCRRGEINLCNARRVLGVSCEDYRQNGAFAEFVAVPSRILYRVPAALSFEQAALAEPFAIALHAVRRAAPVLNDTVVVFGAGMIGLALVQALRQSGCGQLLVVDLAPDRLELASKLGATHVLNPKTEDVPARIQQLTAGQGAECAFEAVGLSSTVELALRSVRKGGSVTLVGNVSPKVDFPLQLAVTRELTLYGSCASRGEYPACLDMLARGALAAAPLLSAVAPLAEGAAWFNRLHRQESGLLKVVLKPNANKPAVTSSAPASSGSASARSS